MERYNVVVIGGGSGGLVVAAGAAGLGARAALVEKHLMGGDCLNTGCVPSKALLRAAKAAHAVREAPRFAIRGTSDPGTQDLKAVMAYVRSCQATIAPHDSIERFTGLGVEVYRGGGRLKSAHEVEIEGTGKTVWGRHVVIATGSHPRIPDIPGLRAAGFVTSETIWDCDRLPDHLVVMGGGPIGVEIGQAFRRLGSKVTIVSDAPHVCPRDEAGAAALLAKQLRAEGIEILDASRATSVAASDGRKVVAVTARGSAPREIDCDMILVAAGRVPGIDGLNLDGVGVAHDADGIKTDAACRTNVRSIWAIGDVTGQNLFTHWSGYQARVVVQNVLFPVGAKCDYENLPRVTYTDPEIACVGWTEEAAKEANVRYAPFQASFADNDRAICDGEFKGYFAKVLAGPKGRILGATIVHPHAGDLLAEIVLAKKNGLTLADLSKTIHAYPGLSEINQSLGHQWQKTKLTPTLENTLTKVYAWLRR